jgi:hypothetical protein
MKSVRGTISSADFGRRTKKFSETSRILLRWMTDDGFLPQRDAKEEDVTESFFDRIMIWKGFAFLCDLCGFAVNAFR